jgi:hypothetical protein
MNRQSFAAEVLENRVLMAANAFLDANHVLHVNGYAMAKNTIEVGYNAGATEIEVSVVGLTPGGVTKNFSASFDVSRVINRVRIRGGYLEDTISIDQTNAPFALRAVIDGGPSKDTITGGAGNDWIRGGAGNDTLSGGGGNDKMFGGWGNDTMNGGDGNDIMWGGRGNDTLNGGAGDDKLGGVLGTNTLLGGEGHDTFVVRTLVGNTNDYNAGEDTLVTVPGWTSDSNDPAPLAP